MLNPDRVSILFMLYGGKVSDLAPLAAVLIYHKQIIPHHEGRYPMNYKGAMLLFEVS